MQIAERFIAALIGSLVILIGIAMLVLPGLAILVTEFEWARRWLRRVQGLFRGKEKETDGSMTAPSVSIEKLR